MLTSKLPQSGAFLYQEIVPKVVLFFALVIEASDEC